MPAGTSVTIRKPTLAIHVDDATVKFPERYYAEIGSILAELGVPRATVPVMAQDIAVTEVASMQAVTQDTDFARLISSLLPAIGQWAGIQAPKVTAFIDVLFDHHAWVDRGGWSIVVKPSQLEPYPNYNLLRIAHALAHCARYACARDTYLKQKHVDFFARDDRRRFRVNMPLAEDVINEGFAIAGTYALVPNNPARNQPVPWYDTQVASVLQQFFAARESTGDDRYLFMGDRELFPEGENWQKYPGEMVFAGQYLGYLLVNQAYHEIQSPWRVLLQMPADRILDFAFAHLRRPGSA